MSGALPAALAPIKTDSQLNLCLSKASTFVDTTLPFSTISIPRSPKQANPNDHTMAAVATHSTQPFLLALPSAADTPRTAPSTTLIPHFHSCGASHSI